MRKLLVFSLSILVTLANAQQSDETQIKNTINTFFTGMRSADSMLLKNTLAPAALLQTIVVDNQGKTAVKNADINKFILTIGTPHKEIYDERIEFGSIKTDGMLASVWTPYKFYVGEKFSYCGVNSFQLVKLHGEWKIQYIIDTRKKNGCE
jgi:sporulation-control protein spo0M